MALLPTEFRGTVIPRFVTDSTGALVTVGSPDGTAFGAVIPDFLTDVDGRLVVAAGAVAAINGGFPFLANGGLVSGSADATPVGGVLPGLLTDAQGRLVTGSPPIASIQQGLPRAANGALVAGPGVVLSQMVLTPVASDNFNRANGTVSGANNWVGISQGGMNLTNNEAIGIGGLQCGNFRSGETYTNNHYSQCTLGNVPLTSGGYIGVSVRNQNNLNCYLLIYFFDGSNYYLQLYKKVGPTPTYTVLYQNALGAAPIAAGTVLRLVAEGNILQVWLGNAIQSVFKDTTFPTGGSAGIEAFNANSLDNWVGGSAASVALGSALASDAFTRADGNVSVGSSGAWVLMNYPYAGGATVEIPIVSNQLSAQNPPVLFHAGDVRTDAYASDHWSQVAIGSTAMNASGFVGAVTRNQGAGGTLGNSGYLFTAFQNNFFDIHRLDNGNSTPLAAVKAADAAAGTINTFFGAGTTITGVSQGSRHSIRINSSEIVAVNDATYTGGKPGMMMFGNATADNWSGGNV